MRIVISALDLHSLGFSSLLDNVPGTWAKDTHTSWDMGGGGLRGQQCSRRLFSFAGLRVGVEISFSEKLIVCH